MIAAIGSDRALQHYSFERRPSSRGANHLRRGLHHFRGERSHSSRIKNDSDHDDCVAALGANDVDHGMNDSRRGMNDSYLGASVSDLGRCDADRRMNDARRSGGAPSAGPEDAAPGLNAPPRDGYGAAAGAAGLLREGSGCPPESAHLQTPASGGAGYREPRRPEGRLESPGPTRTWSECRRRS